MKSTLLRSVAASALLIGASVAVPATGYIGAAMAQTNDTTTQPPADNNAQPATPPADNSGTAAPSGDSGGAAAPSGDATTPSTGDKNATPPANESTTPSTDEKGAAPADNSAATSGKSGEKIITEQKDTEVLASTYIGQSVYNAQNKSIGDISDLVFDKKGGIQAAVIGVGGFLGIGQKNVAVKFDRIKIERKPDSADVKLVTDMTSDELKTAPAFKNLQAKMDEENAKKAPAAPAAGGMGTGGAAGTGGAGTAPAQ